jgi:hypothetical protein
MKRAHPGIWLATAWRSALVAGIVIGCGTAGMVGWQWFGGSARFLPFVATAVPAALALLVYTRLRWRKRFYSVLDFYAEQEIARLQQEQRIRQPLKRSKLSA